MLSASGPQGVSASTGLSPAHHRVRLAEPVAPRDLDVEQVDLPVTRAHLAPRVQQHAGVGQAIARDRGRVRGIPPAAARHPSRRPAAACAARLDHLSARRLTALRTVLRRPAAVVQGFRQAGLVVLVAAQIGKVLGQTDQLGALVAGLVHQRAGPFQVGGDVLGGTHLHRGDSHVHVSKLARPVRRPDRSRPAVQPMRARKLGPNSGESPAGGRRGCGSSPLLRPCDHGKRRVPKRHTPDIAGGPPSPPFFCPK